MKHILSLTVFCVIFGLVTVPANTDENQDIDKRYLAALAKNGRLPKFANAQKKNQHEEVAVSSEKDESAEEFSKDALTEDKRHVGAFLKAHGRPIFTRSDSYNDGKRNVASMARLGRLNALRFARMQPYSVGGKRMSSEDNSNNDEDNAISMFEDPDCFESEEDIERPIWMQKKRYVAALARTGRLPIWHSQRMWWNGKRDDTPRPYFGSSRLQDNDEEDNTLDGISFTPAKNKRCKKVYDYQMGKRNVAALAKNGKLPFRSNA